MHPAVPSSKLLNFRLETLFSILKTEAIAPNFHENLTVCIQSKILANNINRTASIGICMFQYQISVWIYVLIVKRERS
jgi:hypothetical protein